MGGVIGFSVSGKFRQKADAINDVDQDGKLGSGVRGLTFHANIGLLEY